MRFVFIAFICLFSVFCVAEDTTISFVLPEGDDSTIHSYQLSECDSENAIQIESLSGDIKYATKRHAAITIEDGVEYILLQKIMPLLSDGDHVIVTIESDDVIMVSISMHTDDFAHNPIDKIMLSSIFNGMFSNIIADRYTLISVTMSQIKTENSESLQDLMRKMKLFLEEMHVENMKDIEAQRVAEKEKMRSQQRKEVVRIEIPVDPVIFAGLGHLLIGGIIGDWGNKLVGLFLLLK